MAIISGSGMTGCWAISDARQLDCELCFIWQPRLPEKGVAMSFDEKLLQPHPAAKFLQQSGDAGSVTRVTGYVGDSSDATLRIHPDPLRLSTVVELRRDAVKYVEAARQQGRVTVWVAADAEIVIAQTMKALSASFPRDWKTEEGEAKRGPHWLRWLEPASNVGNLRGRICCICDDGGCDCEDGF